MICILQILICNFEPLQKFGQILWSISISARLVFPPKRVWYYFTQTHNTPFSFWPCPFLGSKKVKFGVWQNSDPEDKSLIFGDQTVKKIVFVKFGCWGSFWLQVKRSFVQSIVIQSICPADEIAQRVIILKLIGITFPREKLSWPKCMLAKRIV